MSKRVAQAGGIVFQLKDGSPRFLLVRAKQNPEHWIFPKGHLERGESGRDAAIREVREEAGVEGEALAHLGTSEFLYKGRIIQVEFYLLRYSRTISGGEERESRWCTYEEALALLSFDDSRNLLSSALPLIRKHLETSPSME